MAKRKNPEDQFQGMVFDIIRLYGVRNLIAWHTPNAARRSLRSGARLKRLGMLAGVADIALVIPGGRIRFLELKLPTTNQSEVQEEFEASCILNGSPYAVARTSEEASAQLFAWGCLTEDPLRPAVQSERRAA